MMFSSRYGSSKLLNLSAAVATRSKLCLRSFLSVQFKENGDPYKVLDVVQESEKSLKIGSDEVELKMLYSPINGSDIDRIEGRLGSSLKFPEVAGQDGIAEVSSVGSSVKALSIGDWVVPLPGSHLGTWCNLLRSKEINLLKVPKDIPAEYGSGIGINASTAYHLLHSVKTLKSGDVIIHNAASSAVGIAIIQMAKAMDVRTINVVRMRPMEDYSTETIACIGGDFIVFEEYLHTPDFYSLISDIQAPCMAFDAVGGRSGTDMFRALGQNGTFVRYGNVSKQPVEFPQSLMRSRNIKVEEFSLEKTVKNSKAADREKVVNNIAELIRNEKLIMFFETHPFSQLSNALDRYYEPYKYRKVLLDMSI